MSIHAFSHLNSPVPKCAYSQRNTRFCPSVRPDPETADFLEFHGSRKRAVLRYHGLRAGNAIPRRFAWIGVTWAKNRGSRAGIPRSRVPAVRCGARCVCPERWNARFVCFFAGNQGVHTHTRTREDSAGKRKRGYTALWGRQGDRNGHIRHPSPFPPPFVFRPTPATGLKWRYRTPKQAYTAFPVSFVFWDSTNYQQKSPATKHRAWADKPTYTAAATTSS